MKRYLIYILASVVVLTAGCAKENTGEKGLGSARFVCQTDGEIAIAPQSRAANTIPAPTPAEFKLQIKGSENYDKIWETLAAYNTENPLIKEGSYTASVNYGTPDTEGPGESHFFGEKNFSIEARKTSQVEIKAQMTKSVVVVRATPQFLSYFHDIKFTVETGSSNKFDFNLDAPGYTEALVYVKAGTSLAMTGTAHRQSQTGADNGLEIKFDKVDVAAAEVRKCYVLSLDAANAGSVKLTITIGEEYTETRELSFEMNDDAIL